MTPLNDDDFEVVDAAFESNKIASDLIAKSLQEYADKRAQSLENFIACYLHETGLNATEIELIETHSADNLQIRWRCEPKKELNA
jgi:hypothetical protein